MHINKLLLLSGFSLVAFTQANDLSKTITVAGDSPEVLNGKVKQLIETRPPMSGQFRRCDTTDFDVKGNEIETRLGTGNGVYGITKYVHKYDSSERKIETTAVPSHGRGKTVYSYNNRGQIINAEDSFTKGKIAYKYDLSNHLIGFILSNSHSIQMIEKDKYDDNALIEKLLYHRRTILKSIYYYTDISFDKNKNWIKRTEIWKNRKGKTVRIEVQRRKTTYYQAN